MKPLPLALVLLLAACRSAPSDELPHSLSLPPGFKSTVFAEGVGPARHMVARPNGDVYVRLAQAVDGKSMVALRDSDGDGKADQIQPFGDDIGGTGIALDQDYLYFSTYSEVWRQALPKPPALLPTAAPERLIMNLGPKTEHNARTLALDGQGQIYVNIGAPSNSCQSLNRFPFVPGQDPCPQLEDSAGIWRFRSDRLDQDLKQGQHFATGVRNAVALDWNPWTARLYLLQHGRDMLHEGFRQHYSYEQGADLPAEEFVDIQAGDNLGWPYCYYDPVKQQKILAPEYGGDGVQTGRCARFKLPLAAFPAHSAPNDLLFYTGGQFPASYHQGAFIAFHGSSHRTVQQRGYHVVFLPFEQGKPGKPVVFADGFSPASPPPTPSEARFRPMGLAQTEDGALLIIDSKQGRIWKITYREG